MHYDAKKLGNIIRQARLELGMTQREVADVTEIDARTVLNIENTGGNPQFNVLYPLIRVLKIDPRDIFYPEKRNESHAAYELHLLVDSLTGSEAKEILPVVQSVLTMLRNKDTNKIE